MAEHLIHVERYLEGLEYPASKEEIIDCARLNDASQEVMDMLDGIAEKEYTNTTELREELGTTVM